MKIARAAGKTRDITGGLPRVAELFEARRPKSPAVVTAIDGIVAFGEVERGQQRIMIEDGDVKESYLIPRGKHVTVHPGDRVRSGDKLCDGPIDPHDILHIAGDAAVQRYLVEEIQAVYRLQGVTISDKHIESIVRQMLRKVAVENPGDTELLEGEEISKARSARRTPAWWPRACARPLPPHAARHHQGLLGVPTASSRPPPSRKPPRC